MQGMPAMNSSEMRNTYQSKNEISQKAMFQKYFFSY